MGHTQFAYNLIIGFAFLCHRNTHFRFVPNGVRAARCYAVLFIYKLHKAAYKSRPTVQELQNRRHFLGSFEVRSAIVSNDMFPTMHFYTANVPSEAKCKRAMSTVKEDFQV